MPPYILNPLDDEEKQNLQQGQNSAPAMTGGGLSFGGGTGASNGGLTSSAPQQQKGAQKQGSGFVNLNQYMQANKGNNLGGQLTGKVQGEVQTGQNALSQGANAFKDASESGSQHWNNVSDDVSGIIGNAGDQTSQDEIDRIRKLSSATYGGPTSFLGTSGGQQAYGSIQKAAQSAKALGSEGGRFSLLDQYFGKPKYGMGEKSLDNLLVQNAPGVQARAKMIGDQAQKLYNEGDKTNQDLNNLALKNAEDTRVTADNTRGALNSALTGFQSDLDQRYQNYLNDTNSYNQAIGGDISDDVLTDQSMRAAGLGSNLSLYDLNLGDYWSPGQVGTRGQFASDKDYAKYLALSQLANEDPTILSASDRGLAGTANGKGSFDTARLNSDLAARDSAWNNDLKSTNSSLNDVNSKISDYQKLLSDLQTSKAQSSQKEKDPTLWQQITNLIGNNSLAGKNSPAGKSQEQPHTVDETGDAEKQLQAKIAELQKEKNSYNSKIKDLNKQKSRKVSRQY